MRDTGVDPLRASWTPVLLGLLVLHAVAFAPAAIVGLGRLLREIERREAAEIALVRASRRGGSPRSH